MAASRCVMFMYFLLPHWVPAAWCRRAQTRIRVEMPSGKLPTTRMRRRDLTVQTFIDIVGADTNPMSTGKIAVGQHLLNAIFHLFSGLFPLHETRLLHNSLGLLADGFLALLSMNRFKHFCHRLHFRTKRHWENILPLSSFIPSTVPRTSR